MKMNACAVAILAVLGAAAVTPRPVVAQQPVGSVFYVPAGDARTGAAESFVFAVDELRPMPPSFLYWHCRADSGYSVSLSGDLSPLSARAEVTWRFAGQPAQSATWEMRDGTFLELRAGRDAFTASARDADTVVVRVIQRLPPSDRAETSYFRFPLAGLNDAFARLPCLAPAVRSGKRPGPKTR
jgi:hypothetical protein